MLERIVGTRDADHSYLTLFQEDQRWALDVLDNPTASPADRQPEPREQDKALTASPVSHEEAFQARVVSPGCASASAT